MEILIVFVKTVRKFKWFWRWKVRQFLLCGCGLCLTKSILMTEELCGSEWASEFDSFWRLHIEAEDNFFFLGVGFLLLLLLLLHHQERRHRASTERVWEEIWSDIFYNFSPYKCYIGRCKPLIFLRAIIIFIRELNLLNNQTYRFVRI